MSRTRGQSSPARRAVWRWVWRLFRREWRQQLLVLSLVTVAVAAAVAGASMAMNAAAATNSQFGNAAAMTHLDATSPVAARAGVAAARARFGRVEVIGHRSVAVPGSVRPLDLRAEDPNGVFGRPLLALRAGRYPANPDEVALTARVADLLSARVGDRVELGGVERTVVGQVENPTDLGDEFALIAPDENAVATTLTLLFDTHRGHDGAAPADGQGQINFAVTGRGDAGPVSALVLVATTLALTLVGLIAAAGFVVVAQRRQRQLGLLAAIGATQRQLRLVTAFNGAIVGTIAAVLGGVLGVLGWVVAAPAVETAAGHRIDRLDLPWGLIAGCLLLAVLMATAAAWWPARSLSRLPVMAALSGRPSRPLPVHRSSIVAGVFLALGEVCIATARPTGDHAQPLLLIAGLVAVVIGMVFAAPAAIRLVASPAARLPFATRLALRDLVRYQARAAAAVAAITLGLGLSVAVLGIAKANEYRADEGNLSDRQLVIRVGDSRTGPDPVLSQAARNRLDARAATIAAALGDPQLFTLDVAMNPATANDPSVREPVALSKPVDADTTELIGYPYVATPQLLQHYRIDPTTIDDSADLLTVRSGDVSLADFTSRPKPNSVMHVQRILLPSYTSSANSLIAQSALRRHGWVRALAGWLVESPRPLTTGQVAAARSAAADLGLTIETRSGQDSLATLRTVATAVGALLALAIVAMTIGLIRSESAGDLRTLTATGAAARTRRGLTASTAGTLALVGVVLGTSGAYAALMAGYRSELDRLAPLPLTQLVLLAVGVPVLATIAGWLLAGREPRTFSRQALD